MKYHGIKIDENLNWKQQISNLGIKFNRANDILLNYDTSLTGKLSKQYFMQYLNLIYIILLVWAQNSDSIKKLFTLQNKSLRLVILSQSLCSYVTLFEKFSNPKLPRKTGLENCLFKNIYLDKVLSPKTSSLSQLILVYIILVGPI